VRAVKGGYSGIYAKPRPAASEALFRRDNSEGDAWLRGQGELWRHRRTERGKTARAAGSASLGAPGRGRDLRAEGQIDRDVAALVRVNVSVVAVKATPETGSSG